MCEIDIKVTYYRLNTERIDIYRVRSIIKIMKNRIIGRNSQHIHC